MRVAVIGAGWAGCAAAVEAARRGHRVQLLEAARDLGGRARKLDIAHPSGGLRLDNGQHILIGAYSQTLRLMRDLGVAPQTVLARMPLTLQTPDGLGLSLPRLGSAHLSVIAGVMGARGWSWRDKASLVRCALAWQRSQFECDASLSVTQLCQPLSPAVFQSLIEPLCVSALNTPADCASAKVFLRVLKDALLGERGSADLLLPRTDLSALLPDAACAWLEAQGHAVRRGVRLQALHRTGDGWRLQTQSDEQTCDAVLLACPPWEAARLVQALPAGQGWAQIAASLHHAPIATVYAWADKARLARPMLALWPGPDAPAQFVFDRGQLDGHAGLLAFVVSASQGSRDAIERAVLAQARAQLGLRQIEALSTVVEKRATFSCTPNLQRPGRQPLTLEASLQACGDYVDGPYPATLEGAVRSGLAAARALGPAAPA